MSDIDNDSKTTKNGKMLESSFPNNLILPAGIILISALIIFGVTKMLNTERSYKDLVREMQSKTFGNRWIAAYELSKVISTKSVPKDEVPWLVENLGSLYDSARDNRTKQFIVVALGAMRSEYAMSKILKALNDKDPSVRFHAMVAIGNMPKGINLDWSPILKTLFDKDLGIKQAAILALSTHRVKEAEPVIVKLLRDSNVSIRYADASGLIHFKNPKAINTIQEILFLSAPAKGDRNSKFDSNKIYGLKINVINALRLNNWNALNKTLKKVITKEKNLKIVSSARDLLNQLKN